MRTGLAHRKPKGSGAGRHSEAAPLRSGFIPSSTSHKGDYLGDGISVIDTKESRDRRMRSSVLTTARLLNEQSTMGSRRHRVAFVTLTYRDVDGWQSKHLSAFNNHVRNWCARRSIPYRYVFKAELQRRGAVHYHLLIWLPKGISLPKPDKQGWWPHGMTQMQWARNPIAYIAKYASKCASSQPFPKGIRYFGSGGLRGNFLLERRWWTMPTWVRSDSTPADQPIRAIGGGIIFKSTGEYRPSPYDLVSCGGGKVVIIKKAVLQ